MVVIFVLRNRARAAMEITLRVQERNYDNSEEERGDTAECYQPINPWPDSGAS